MIARSASGSFRDAIGTLDQLVTYGGSKVTLDDVLEVLDVADADLIFGATDALVEHDPGAALERVQELADSGRDPVQFMRDLTAHLRQLVVVQTLGEAPDSFSVTADQTARLEAQARELPQAEAVRAIDLSPTRSPPSRRAPTPRIQLEVALLKAARPRADASIEALLLRIEQLERGSRGGDGSRRAERADAPPQPRRAGPRRRAASPSRARAEAAPTAPPREPPVVGDRDALAGGARARARERGRRDARGAARRRPPGVARGRRAGARVSRSRPRSASARSSDPANGERLRRGAEARRRPAGRACAFELRDARRPTRPSRAARPRIDEDQVIERIKDEFDAEDCRARPGARHDPRSPSEGALTCRSRRTSTR